MSDAAPPTAHSRPWVLVEDPSPVVEVSDFSRFRDAGFEVALCRGPDRSAPCPLASGERCPLAEAADVVMFGLDLDGDAGQRVLRAHLRQHPRTPVVVQVPRGRDAQVPDDCTVLAFPATVEGQTRALWKALGRSGWRAGAPADAVTRTTTVA